MKIEANRVRPRKHQGQANRQKNSYIDQDRQSIGQAEKEQENSKKVITEASGPAIQSCHSVTRHPGHEDWKGAKDSDITGEHFIGKGDIT